MIKLTAVISKRDEWTREEWLSHYRDRHAPLTASVRNFTRHGVRYLQNYALHGSDIPHFAAHAAHRVAVTELWFETVEALRTAYAEPDYMKYLRTDELRFCTFEDLAAGVAREELIFESDLTALGDKKWAHAPRNKMFVFRTERAGLERAAFQQAWLEERAPLLTTAEPFKRVRRYVQSQMLDVDVGIPGGVSHGLIDEFWFDSNAEAVAFWAAYSSSDQMRADDARYTQPEKTWLIFAREHEVFGPLGG